VEGFVVVRYYDILDDNFFKMVTINAFKEHVRFIKNNEDFVSNYRLEGFCLCQGCALHYLYPDEKIGFKDVDVWFFYSYLFKAYKVFPFRVRMHNKVSMRYPLDYMKRVIPNNEVINGNAEETIMEFLLKRDVNSKRLLLEKAIIGLYPKQIFMKVLWKPDMTDDLREFYRTKNW